MTDDNIIMTVHCSICLDDSYIDVNYISKSIKCPFCDKQISYLYVEGVCVDCKRKEHHSNDKKFKIIEHIIDCQKI